MAKLRHVAIMAAYPEKTARFYTEAFEMAEVGRKESAGGMAIYLSDGMVNLAIFSLNQKAGDQANSGRPGLNHIGFVVDDREAMTKRLEALGGTCVLAPPAQVDSKTTYEVKFEDPDGVSFDIAVQPWPGVTL